MNGKMWYLTQFNSSLFQVIKEGNFITGDLGGSAKCSEFTNEIIKKIEAM